jgi:hypothetical protein
VDVGPATTLIRADRRQQSGLSLRRRYRNFHHAIMTRAPCFLLTCLWVAACATSLCGQTSLQNKTYTVELQADASIKVTGAGGAVRVFRPDFTVLYRSDNPSYGHGAAPENFYIRVPEWKTPTNQKTTDVFQVAPAVNLNAAKGSMDDGAIRWSFPEQSGFTLSAAVGLPEPDGEPRISFTLTPAAAGYYSVGYYGAPKSAPSEVDALWLPPAWQEKRFPANPVMASENICAMPTAMLEAGGVTCGVVADPECLPFRMPTLANARCGLVLRTPAGEAQPIYLAPVMGGVDSQRAADSPFTSHFRLSVRTGGIYETYRHLATHLFGMRDFRQNTLTSLNGTLENMIGFALDDVMAGWNPDLRGCDYSTDVPDTVKVVSALHPLSIARITDSEEIFRRRAIPMIEYLLSREKYLFTTDATQKGQGASAQMLGPTAEVFEWSSLYQFSGRRSGVFKHSALRRFNEPRALNQNVLNTDGKFADALALYRATGNREHLDLAKKLADTYVATQVNTPRTGWPDHAEFFTDFAPRWMQLLEMWEETGEARYRDAAVAGARMYSQYCAVSPKIPDGEVTVNMKIYQPGSARVPAWRVSQTGLTPEATNTHLANPAVFLAHYAPFFLRVATLSDDTFLRDLARNAVVGRYSNYPGYDINDEFSTVYEQASYPTTPPVRNHRYNQIYFNHVWPHIALLMDYLVSDAVVRSGGAIDFPSRFAQGYVYLQSKVYGDRPGKFYGDENVWLYLPPGLVAPGNVQLNYVAGRGNGNLYLAFTNQSPDPVTTTVTLNPALLPTTGSHTARVWQENKQASPLTVTNGRFQMTIAPKGITAIAIDGMNTTPAFQHRMGASRGGVAGDASFAFTVHPQLGKISGMILDFGQSLSSAYVWLDAPATALSAAKLVYRNGDGPWKEATDQKFPYEFRVPLDDPGGMFEYRIGGTPASGGAIVPSADQLLKHDAPR